MIHNTVFDTAPLAVHAPQAADCPWWEIVRAELFGSQRRYEDPESLAVITWNSGAGNVDIDVRGHALGTFERSVEHIGLSVEVLGSGIGTAWSNVMKLDLTIDFLERTDAPYVMGGDSSDVLLVGDPGEILRRFRSGDAEVVFNGEKNFWPSDLHELQEWERHVGLPPFTYMNSGLWIGRRESCLEFFQHARTLSAGLDAYPRSDQARVKLAYREFYPAVRVDHRCEMFQNINRVDDEITVNGRTLPSRPHRWLSRRLRRLRGSA